MKSRKIVVNDTLSVDHTFFYTCSISHHTFFIPTRKVLNQMNELFEMNGIQTRFGPDYDASGKIIVQSTSFRTVGIYHPLDPGETPATPSLYEAKQQLRVVCSVQCN